MKTQNKYKLIPPSFPIIQSELEANLHTSDDLLIFIIQIQNWHIWPVWYITEQVSGIQFCTHYF